MSITNQTSGLAIIMSSVFMFTTWAADTTSFVDIAISGYSNAPDGGATITFDALLSKGDHDTLANDYNDTLTVVTAETVEEIAVLTSVESLEDVNRITITNAAISASSKSKIDVEATLYISAPTSTARFFKVLGAGKVVDLESLTSGYLAQDGDVLTGNNVGYHKITIADGATVALKNATISLSADNDLHAGITCLGDATIVIAGENIVNVQSGISRYPAIFAAENKTLTIKGTGSLTASSNGYSCGIGGGYGTDCGNIVIESGIIRAIGSDRCAGIGSGGAHLNGDQGAYCGDITINGGIVHAYSPGGSGIGCGYGGICGNIVINGGEVLGDANYAGIGSAGYDSKCGDIVITGGLVSGRGGVNGPGVGAGCGGECGYVMISGGSIYAYAGSDCAAIGSGREAVCGDITVKNTVSQVTVEKGYGPTYIGAGYNGSCGTVTIEDGVNLTEN